VPVPYPDSRIPVSLQLVGPDRGEELLIAAGYMIEQATAGS
jgi:Asp-tRNA(Asn)/Glu-tRNA(Gln) amidotransferase A subunit family amidase